MAKDSSTTILTNNHCHKQVGFTLIEMLVATTIGAMILISVSILFFSIATNTAKINARKEIRETGSAISQNFDYIIKNALTLLPDDNGVSCDQGATTSLANLRLESIDGGVTNIKIVNIDGSDYIASNSAKLNPKEIHPSNLEFLCIKNPTGETYVNYKFKLDLNNLATQDFSGFVLLRNVY